MRACCEAFCSASAFVGAEAEANCCITFPDDWENDTVTVPVR